VFLNISRIANARKEDYFSFSALKRNETFEENQPEEWLRANKS
jgi:hypothetical protein